MRRAVSVAAVLLAGWACACACGARRIPARDTVPHEQKFWSGCTETAPAEADGFQHFVCTDVNKKQWEVLLRRRPK